MVITILAVFNLPDYAQGVPPIPTIVGFFTVAFVSWLSARSLEDALVDLHTINRELDQRVELRTHELKEANQELANAYEQLKELDRLKSMFVSIISHELRTPLSAIQGFAEMLIAEVFGAVSQEQIGALERIIANDKHLLNLVNDLLDEARLSAGQLSLHVEPFAPKALLGDMYVTMSVLAEQQELSLTTELDPLLPETLQGDQKRLHQILVNLVNNAIKFTEKGGIHVRIYQTDAISWAMNVTDTGPGIAEEAQKYIFEPFRQVENPETRKHKGFGLGLSIVNQLVTLMDGKIILTSQLGEGTTFSIRLPLMLPEPALPKE
ncbi:MAG: hypothetical protein JXA33_06310 [Anaerolineae bacterium]|nr:hypothetical protein [Anaerolineae bacterium]